MLDMVKIKNCWLILNFFGYDSNLKLKVDLKETQITLEKYYTMDDQHINHAQSRRSSNPSGPAEDADSDITFF